MPTLGVAIVTYNGAARTEELLKSLEPERRYIDKLVVAEDPCPYPQVHQRLVEASIKYYCDLVTGSTWGCMQGNATMAMNYCDTDVVCLLSDDILVTPGCIKAMREFWETYWHLPIGLAQFSYWGNWSDLVKLNLIADASEFWPRWPEYITKVPRNEFWDNGGKPRIYINVNGSGFAIRRDIWKTVGGFSPETWCYDEDIAVRVWLNSPTIVVTVPGPPFVHFGGASQCGTEHPDTDYHTLLAWVKAWGYDKFEIEPMLRAKMKERAYVEEFFQPLKTSRDRLGELIEIAKHS